MRPVFMILLGVVLAACGKGEERPPGGAGTPFVRTVAVAQHTGGALALSGVVRARYETPLAFQVGGRMMRRHADDGARVRAGQVLFELDPRDLEQSVAAAQAELAAAEAALATARADTQRARQLVERQFVSAQALERSVLAEREAQARLDAARARWVQARNGLAYALLRAPAAGVLTQVSGEPGEVVAAGRAVAVLAHAGEQEIEVFFPEQVRPPAAGRLAGSQAVLRLREVSGAVDPQSRTWRARYRVEGTQPLALGAVVRAEFAMSDADALVLSVPLAALDERGEGPRLWRVVAGRAQPVAVTVVSVDEARARVRGNLKPGDKVIALGTHLLVPGMAVRETAQ